MPEMKYNIKIILNEVGCEGFDWSNLSQDRVERQDIVLLGNFD
jgi:hypothetical protein